MLPKVVDEPSCVSLCGDGALGLDSSLEWVTCGGLLVEKTQVKSDASTWLADARGGEGGGAYSPLFGGLFSYSFSSVEAKAARCRGRVFAARALTSPSKCRLWSVPLLVVVLQDGVSPRLQGFPQVVEQLQDSYIFAYWPDKEFRRPRPGCCRRHRWIHWIGKHRVTCQAYFPDACFVPPCCRRHFCLFFSVHFTFLCFVRWQANL